MTPSPILPFAPPVMMYRGSTDAPPDSVALGMSIGPQGSAPTFGVFEYGNALYCAIQTSGTVPTPALIWMMRSLDGGLTWDQADLLNSPSKVAPGAGLSGGCVFDGDHTVIFAYTVNDTAVDGAIQLQNFDLSTNLWGAVYGTATAPVVGYVSALFRRSNGSLFAMFNRARSGGTLVGLSGASFAAGAWGARFNLDTNVVAGRTTTVDAAGVHDPQTGVIHFFVSNRDALFNRFTLYQQVRLSNTLGAFTNFAAGLFSPLVFGENNPIIVGDRILWGVPAVAGAYPTLVIGTPLSAPVFSVLGSPGIDPQIPAAPGSIQYAAALMTVGHRIYAVYPVQTNAGAFVLRLAQVPNSAAPTLGWFGQTIYDSMASSVVVTGSLADPSIAFGASRLLVTMYAPPLDYPIGGFATATNFFLKGPPIAGNITVVLRGVKRYKKPVVQSQESVAPVLEHVDRAI